MCSFYSMSPNEAMDLDCDLFYGLWDAITPLEARAQLSLLNAMDWPNLKPNAKKKQHRELYKIAYPEEMKPKKYLDIKDVQRILAR